MVVTVNVCDVVGGGDTDHMAVAVRAQVMLPAMQRDATASVPADPVPAFHGVRYRDFAAMMVSQLPLTLDEVHSHNRPAAACNVLHNAASLTVPLHVCWADGDRVLAV